MLLTLNNISNFTPPPKKNYAVYGGTEGQNVEFDIV